MEFSDSHGRIVPVDTILCDPGNWHCIKNALPDGERWSTGRFGIMLLAQVLPVGMTVEFLLRNMPANDVTPTPR